MVAAQCTQAAPQPQGKSARTPAGLPLPSPVHAVLPAELSRRGRLIIVGDVHGCSAELQDLMDKCEFQQGADTLILVGDLVGKGPHPAQAVQLARRLQALAVRGNWDENYLALADGRQTVEAMGVKKARQLTFDPQLTPEDREYLRKLPFTLSMPSHGVCVVHAGFVPGVPIQQQSLEDMIEVRHVDLRDPTDERGGWKALPKLPREAGRPWGAVWQGPPHVVFGHHATRRLQLHTHTTGLDTGCCEGDQLTALVLPPAPELEKRGFDAQQAVTREDLGAQLVSVQAHKQYCAKD